MRQPGLGSSVIALVAGLALCIWFRAMVGPDLATDPANQHGLTGSPAVSVWPAPEADQRLDNTLANGPLCLSIDKGAIRSTYTISNPHGIHGFQPYVLANFSQRVVAQSATAIEVEITTDKTVDTYASYPVDRFALPASFVQYLSPEPNWIQSDDPAIVAEALRLVAGSRTQVAAVDAVLTWVRATIAYDYTFSRPNDAVSVYRNHTAVCSGFSTVSVALLRAAGIPARVHTGCVAPIGWVVGPEGGWHAWIEVYYPDVGWIASDPQVTENFVDTAHFFGGFGACGNTGTVITRTVDLDDSQTLYRRRTNYSDSVWQGLAAAEVPGWDRHPLQIVPAPVRVLLPLAEPTGTVRLQVDNQACLDQGWQVRSATQWLGPEAITGTQAGEIVLSLDATGAPPGLHSGAFVAFGAADPWPDVISRTVAVDVWLVERVHALWLPQIAEFDSP